MKNPKRYICIALTALLLLTSCSADKDTLQDTDHTSEAVTPSFDENDLYAEYDADKIDGIIVFDGDAAASGDGVSVKGSVVTVSSEGVYKISGSSSDGQIIVNCSNKDDVTLIFDNLSLNCKGGPAVWCTEADTLTISLPADTSSSISDGSYRSSKDIPDAAIYSKGDLYINGSGSLCIIGNANNALESRDSLTVLQSALDITAVDDGIIGKDGVEISSDAAINVASLGDGIRSTNDEEQERGSIYIGKCTIIVDSGADSIQAANSLTIDLGASLDLTSDSKGLKASDSIFIKGGAITADCADDAIHCNGNVNISNGTVKLASYDDGIHADSAVNISGGSVLISKSYEGLEANTVTVSGGTVDLISSDDGINVAGGNDSSSSGGNWGRDKFASDESCLFSISGGRIFINAAGDGVDSNGSIKMSGGEMYVSGPTDGGNGVLDYAGDFEITGGTLLAVGTSAMAQSTNAGTQPSVAASVNGTVPSGTVLSIKTADGQEIVSYTSPKNFNYIVASAPLMKEGEAVSFYLDGELIGSLDASVVIGGNGMGMGGGHGGHGPGGRP